MLGVIYKHFLKYIKKTHSQKLAYRNNSINIKMCKANLQDDDQVRYTVVYLILNLHDS